MSHRTNIQQSGKVTPGHGVQWVTDGVIEDAGPAATSSEGVFLPLSGGTLTGPLNFSQFGSVQSAMYPTTQSAGDPWIDPSALQLGGITAGYGGYLYIRGQPVGFYDLGATLSVTNSSGILGNSRAGISGGFENGVSAMAAYGGLDSVVSYAGSQNVSAPLIVSSGVTYDAGNIYFATPLTSAQMSHLRRNMWVLTNSIDSSVNTAPSQPNGLKKTNLYASTITGWAANGTSIQVRGWTVPGSGHTAAGQVPSTTYDTTAGNSTATVYLGQQTTQFTANWRMDNTLAGATGYVHAFNSFELDMLDTQSTADYENLWTGLALVFTPGAGHFPTSDSFMLAINANAMPTGITLTMGTYPVNPINGATGPTYFATDYFSLWGGQTPAGTPAGAAQVQAEWLFYAESNLLRTMLWSERISVGPGGWPYVSVNLGMHIDGSRGRTDGTQTGTLVFNPLGQQGIALKTAGGLGVLVDTNAATTIGELSLTGVLYPHLTTTAALTVGAGHGGLMEASDAINPQTNTNTGPMLVNYRNDGTWRIVGSNNLAQTTPYTSIVIAPGIVSDNIGNLNLQNGVLQQANNQVVGGRIGGYGTPTGNIKYSSFNGASATLPQTSAMLAQLIIDLETHGLIGI